MSPLTKGIVMPHTPLPLDYVRGRDNFFQELPPEIRMLIFNYFIPPHGNQSIVNTTDSVPLIAALRPQPRSYEEIVTVFFQRNWFSFKLDTCWSLKAITLSSRSLITKLCLSIPIAPQYVHRDNPKRRFVHRYSRFILAAAKELVALRVLEIRFRVSGDALLNPALGLFPSTFPTWLRHFTQLRILQLESPDFVSMAASGEQRRIIHTWRSVVEHVDRQLGVKARENWASNAPVARFSWRAPKGETMDWPGVSAKDHDAWDLWGIEEVYEEGVRLMFQHTLIEDEDEGEFRVLRIKERMGRRFD